MSRTARRPLLMVLLLLSTAIAWAAPATPSSGQAPATTVRHVSLRLGPATTVAGWSGGQTIPAGDAVLVGASWQGAEDLDIEVRSRRGGTWGPWRDLHTEDEHAPDPGSSEAARAQPGQATDPVWIGRSELIEVRSRGGAGRDVELRLVDVGGGDGLAYVPPEVRGIGGFAAAATTAPPIVSRASWGADESIRRYTPLYAQQARFSIVHHTAGNNDYTRAEADDLVRAIYAYHVESRGWDDIAYNFLVDRYGTVYEGRSGGIEEAVIGAHAAGWNEGSIGVAVMGDFSSATPPAAAVEALDGLLAWKLDIHHIDPHGETTEIAGGGTSNRYDRGDRVTFPTIIGHRTNNTTKCPGDALFDRVLGADPAADRVEPIGLPKAYGGLPPRREQPLAGTRPRITTRFTEPLDWRLMIRDEETGEVIRSTGGLAANGVDLTWDLRDPDGDPVAPGSYTAEVLAGSGASQITPVTSEMRVTPPAERLGGETRIETAVEISRRTFPSARRVVIAAASAYPDALVASPLAGSFGAPVLLVPPDDVPEVVLEEIRRLRADEAWIVGGEARISAAVGRRIVRDTFVLPDELHRLAGADRFATAAAVARVVMTRENPEEVLLALGTHDDESRAFPDALSAGAFGATFDLPVLLVRGAGLTTPTRDVLRSRSWPGGVRLFGGEAAVHPVVVDAAREAAGGAEVTRFAGVNRYDTSRLAADATLQRWLDEAEQDGPDPNADPTGLELVLASGANWPDALGAGASAARRGGVFLLVPPAALDDAGATGEWLQGNAEEISHAFVAGGPAAVSDEVFAAVAATIASAGPNQQPPEEWPPDPFAPGPDPEPTPLPTLPGPAPSGSPSPGAGP